MSHIILTGGTGYIGSALYNHLTAAGHNVDTVDLEIRGNAVNPANRKVDYRSIQNWDCDAIIHLAGHSSVGACIKDSQGAIGNNLTGLLDLAADLGTTPLIYASSASVHAPKTGFTNMYDATKRAAEDMIPLVHSRAIGLRFGTVCGASPNVRTDLMINAMVLSALNSGVVRVSNPQARRPILAIKDLCRAVEGVLDEMPAPSCYNLCSFNAEIGDIGQIVANIMDVPVEFGPPSPTYDFRMNFDAVPGFPPQETITTIVTDLLAQFAKERKAA